ncbi:MAG: ParB/RepB/Spo0J family partition protein [Burkholderiaceae bacterium]|nr:ParB/RepB/Spo0J family partition protein [Burkholderiaceae bacterium]
MVTKLSPREKAALATQMMNKVGAPSASPATSTEAPVRQINSVQIGLAMAGQGGKVAELEKQLHETETTVDAIRADLVAVNAEWHGVLPSKKLDPKLIKPSKWANRHDKSFEGPEFSALKTEMESAGGNVQAIKVRPIPGAAPQEYEIVFGHRRHRACLELGLDVLATIESIDDKELFKEMDRENRQRADLRPYEQGLMYARALDEGLFSSQRKLAEDLGLQSSNVSTAINIARLPKFVLDAFGSPLDIQYRWSAPLNDAIKVDPDMVLSRANEVIASRVAGATISASHVYDRLIGSVKVESQTVSHVVKHSGKTAFKVVVSKDKIAIDLPILSKSTLSRVEKAILAALKEEGALP